ncbi:hypothetical protein NC653_007741 [Populus alba x Populus x berolinensis]|uniref:Uncharacterized protein n=1 Tax=Populus alba x Populus x berolinensis TaxID=444605 RepID=A0AAD6WDY6_9ROSI|nr:hypothetical protein NC653_007741 [Populus alba x Populus x berolinensis]
MLTRREEEETDGQELAVSYSRAKGGGGGGVAAVVVVVYGEKRREELFPILEQRENKVEVKEQQPPPKTVMEIGDNKRQLKDTVAKLELGHQMDVSISVDRCLEQPCFKEGFLRKINIF